MRRGPPPTRWPTAGLEGEAGGPFTDAAEAFDRAGRGTFRRQPVRTDNGRSLRNVGRMVGLLAVSSQNPKAQAAVLSVVMSSLVSAVADLRRVQQRQHQAEAALVAATALGHVAPVAVPVGGSAAMVDEQRTDKPSRPPTAADITRLSVGTGFTLKRPTTPPAPGIDDPPNRQQGRERGPRQGR
jgi:hypothetical protein